MKSEPKQNGEVWPGLGVSDCEISALLKQKRPLSAAASVQMEYWINGPAVHHRDRNRDHLAVANYDRSQNRQLRSQAARRSFRRFENEHLRIRGSVKPPLPRPKNY